MQPKADSKPSPEGKKSDSAEKSPTKATRFGMVVRDALKAMKEGQQPFADRIGIDGPGLNRVLNGHKPAGFEWMSKIVEGLSDEHRPRAVAAWLVDSIDDLPPEIRALVNIVPASNGSDCVVREDSTIPPRPQLDSRRMEILLWVERQILRPTFLEMLESQKSLIGG